MSTSSSSSSSSPSISKPSRPRGFSVIIEGIPDGEPMEAVRIPSRWISQLLINLGLGKIKVRQGMAIYSRYSTGCPRNYFISIIVHFESTINEELRTALATGQDIKLTYATKGEPHYQTGKPIPKDKFLTIKQYKAHTSDEQDDEQRNRDKTHRAGSENAKQRKIAKQTQQKPHKNIFSELNIEE